MTTPIAGAGRPRRLQASQALAVFRVRLRLNRSGDPGSKGRGWAARFAGLWQSRTDRTPSADCVRLQAGVFEGAGSELIQ
jgi:hypothetical protein